MTSYQSAVDHLFSANDSSKFRIEQCFQKLGLVEFVQTVPVIHVTGSKGKGTTAVMTANLLHRLHGKKVGIYTSPHIRTVRERIMFNSFQPVCEDTFAQAYNYCRNSAPQFSRLGYHDAIFVVAVYIFAQAKADLLVVEVHSGGLNDSTNVFGNCQIVVVTNVTLEHCASLGQSCSEILQNKLGLVHKSTKAVVTTMSCVRNEFKTFNACKVRVLVVNDLRDPMCKFEYTKLMAFRFAETVERIFSGRFTENPLADQDLMYSMTLENKMPARRQFIQNSEHVYWYIDGAHTPESFSDCVDWFMGNTGDIYKILIFTLTGDREVEYFEQSMTRGKFNTIMFTVPIKDEKALHPQDVTVENALHHEYARKCMQNTSEKYQQCSLLQKGPNFYESMQDAVNHVNATAKRHGKCAVLVSGSLYLCASALSILES